MMRRSAYSPMVVQQAVVKESATSTTFVIEGKSNIPSGDRTGGEEQKHKVAIAVIDLVPTLERVAVPKQQERAYLRCLVKNSSPYVLLEGQASVFMDNGFVCKTTIPNVSPQESFSTSLGVDPSIRITYHPVIKKTKNSAGGNFGNLLALQAKSDITSHNQRITIKNTRSQNVSLIVKDQVPVSVDAAMKVMVLEPKDMGEAKERKTVNVASGVKARWAYHDTDGTSEPSSAVGGVEEEGAIEWLCDVGAGKNVDLVLTWDVVVPVGQVWTQT